MTAPLAVFRPAALPATEAEPVDRADVLVMVRPDLAGFALAWCTGQALAALALGAWLGDERMPGVALVCFVLAACCWWCLRFPAGVYEPASNTYVAVWPFGLHCSRLPARPGRTLAVRGHRIVTTGRVGRAVLSRTVTRRGDYAVVARSVGRAPMRHVFAPAGPARPRFLRRRHRVTGWALVAFAAAGLLSQIAQIPGTTDFIAACQSISAEAWDWVGVGENGR